MAILASAGLLSIGCSDKNQYGSNGAKKNSLSQDQLQATPEIPGIGNYLDTQGSAKTSGTWYYDESRFGTAGSSLDTASGRIADSMGIIYRPETRSPATGPGNPGGDGD